jgi:cytosine/adenosine deaminase-related metal-dependent hydrolase
MVLQHVSLIDDDRPVNIHIAGDKIAGIVSGDMPDTLQIDFDQALAFPGLINSHDHLDFNLFPALGNRIYNNYTEWGKYIHEQYKDEIEAVLKVPVPLREQWGILKNLLCGVTTVVNHGEKLQGTHTLIHVHEQYYFVHSVGFEKRWKLKLNHPLKTKLPLVVHIGEGKDMASYHEINQLTKWNLLHKKLIGIHAVAMTEEQAKKFKAVVWCPQSNYFLLNKTAPINRLKMSTRVLFGTDSTLTSSWNIWEHIRLAREIKKLTDAELYASLTTTPAKTWQTGSGEIKAGDDADLVIVKNKAGQNGTDSFFNSDPEDILLVVQRGNIRLFDESLYTQLSQTDLSGYDKVYVNGKSKFVQTDVSGLMKKIKQYYPGVVFPIVSDN